MEETIKNTLTDKELEMVTETLEKEPNQYADAVAAAKKELNGEEVDEEDLGFLDANGNATPVVPDQFAEKSMDEMIDMQHRDITEAEQTETITKLGYEEEEALQLLQLINRVKSGEDFSVYNALPVKAKMQLQHAVGSHDIRVLGAAAREMINGFINELAIDQEFIDFDATIKKEIGDIPTINDMYLEQLYEDMVIHNEEKAKAIEEKDPEKAKELRNVIDTFKTTYTYEKVFDIVNHSNIRNVRKDVTRYKQYYREYNEIASKSQFKIYDINNVERAMQEVFKDEFTLDDIRRFLILVARSCQGLDVSNLLSNVYVYFIGSIIINLGHAELKTDFSKQVADNIRKVIYTFSNPNN